jgi:outer membrane protein assembly factor BamA
MKHQITILCVAFNFILSSICWSQNADSLANKRKITGFPIAYYTPETGVAVGALGVMTWNWQKDSLFAKKSSLTLGFAYTSRKQILFYLPYALFFKNDAYRLNGEIGFYEYVYFYSGIGNVPGTIEEKQEQFEISFPRFRATVYKNVRKNVFLGLRYAFDAYYDLKTEANGLLASEQPKGINAGINSGLGPAFIFDSRDNIFYPRKGYYVDMSSTFDLGEIVSDYKYTRLNIDASYFYAPFKRSVLGFNVNYQQNTGDVPFYQLSLLGGSKRLRGQFEGEFRDKYAWQTQIEYRQEFLKNWGFAAFMGLGWVAPNWNSWQVKNQKLGSGVGIRYKLNKKDHVNIRLDVGFGGGKIYPYLTIGEAF